MLYVYVRRFDVMGNVGKFFELNMADQRRGEKKESVKKKPSKRQWRPVALCLLITVAIGFPPSISCDFIKQIAAKHKAFVHGSILL